MQKRGYFLLGIFLIISGTIISTNSLQNITGLAIASDTSELSNKLSGISFIFAGLFSLFLSKKRKVKGQAAVEFLMTYGWAILAAVVVLGVLAFFGIFNPGALVRGSAIVSPPFYIIAWSVDSNEILLDVENRGSETYSIHKVTVKLDSETISCNTLQFNPIPTISQNKNRVFTIPCPELNSKKRIKGDITMEYTKYSSTLIQTISGTINDRIVSPQVSSSTIFPIIEFKNPTPSNGAIQESNSIFVNVSASSNSNISSFINFDNSLVGWWRFNNLTSDGDNNTKAVDYSGFGNNATFVTNGVKYNNSGKYGSAVDLNTSSYVTMGNNRAFNITQELTAVLWVYPRPQGASTHSFISRIDSSGRNGWHLRGANQLLYMDIGNLTTACGTGGLSVSLPDNTWTQIGLLYNGSRATLIKNGNITNQGQNCPTGGLTYTTARKLELGRLAESATWPYDGLIDDVIIFNRTLSSTEISAIYSNTSTKYYSNNFTNLKNGNHKFRAYVQDSKGNVSSTEVRTITVNSTALLSISFTPPTPANATTQTGNSIFVNVSASDSNNISSFIDFDNSLIGWWRMDDLNASGGVVDHLGKHNGTVRGNAVQNNLGKLGKSFTFVGNGSIYPNTFNFNLTNSTITGWGYVNSADLRGCVGFVFSRPPVSGINIGSCGNSAKIGYHWNGNPTTYGWTGGPNVPTDKWFLVALAVSSTNATAYAISTDGFNSGSNNIYHPSTLINTLKIAVDDNGAGLRFFNGSIDDVMIFNRTLSATEIMALYANTSSKYYSNNFTNLSPGSHKFKAYVQDILGNFKSTELRTVNL